MRQDIWPELGEWSRLIFESQEWDTRLLKEPGYLFLEPFDIGITVEDRAAFFTAWDFAQIAELIWFLLC